jgi:mannose-6-phosphate isomerase-like protein (cupin superfamily)
VKSPEASSERLTIMTEDSEVIATGAGRGAVDIAQKFGRFTEYWSRKIIAESNGWQFKLVKVSGEFVWHQHELDEVFLVFAGQVTIQIQGADDVTFGPGQLFVVPRKTEHRPYAPEGCQLMLLQPAGVVNSGSAPGALTAVDEWIWNAPRPAVGEEGAQCRR